MAKRKTGLADDPATSQDESVEEVELTEDESAAALAVALELKTSRLAAEQAVERAKEEAEKVAAEQAARAEADAASRKATPLKWIGLWLEGDVLDYLPNASDFNDRTVSIGGKNYEHTHEDDDGVWIYRRM